MIKNGIVQLENNELSSVNSIYKSLKLNAAEMPFKTWLESEKLQYDVSGLTKKYDFKTWINMKHIKTKNNGKLHFDLGGALGKIGDVASQVGDFATQAGGVLGQPSNGSTTVDTTVGGAPLVEKTILGMKPIVFYSVASVAAVAVIAGGIMIYKHYNK